MIIIIEMIWVFWSVIVKLVTIGLAHHIVDGIFDALVAVLNRQQGVVIVNGN